MANKFAVMHLQKPDGTPIPGYRINWHRADNDALATSAITNALGDVAVVVDDATDYYVTVFNPSVNPVLPLGADRSKLGCSVDWKLGSVGVVRVGLVDTILLGEYQRPPVANVLQSLTIHVAGLNPATPLSGATVTLYDGVVNQQKGVERYTTTTPASGTVVLTFSVNPDSKFDGWSALIEKPGWGGVLVSLDYIYIASYAITVTLAAE